MPDTKTRTSPIHEWFGRRNTEWGTLLGCPIALRLQDGDSESAAMKSLGLCDLSSFQKIGVKGPGAIDWLEQQGCTIPNNIYESSAHADGSLVARIATDEFFVESVIRGSLVATLSANLNSPQADGVFRVEHQEVTLLLTGQRATEVFAQTCGIDFRGVALRRVIYSRVAGVSCGIYPDSVHDVAVFRIWVDYSFAEYLWETLVEIVEELGGSVIGAASVYPELIS